ncbi:hypothetical protein ACE193_21050 [Bernardetia sp. OM2101]|uniref:hypothetical protein n=1 Tax=Bernardetia sp. OM2101 TaxID=3344876 RepID=UPI0035D105A5
MKKVFENPHAEIYDISREIPNTVFAYWKGYLMKEFEDATTACEESLKYFKEANILVMISDHSHLEGASLEFLDWLHDYYFPTCVKNGLKAELILDSTHSMGNIVLDLMYYEEDKNRNLNDAGLYTPKVDTLENAKILAKNIVEQNKE